MTSLVSAAWTLSKSGAVTNARLLRVDGSRQRIVHRFSGAIVSVSVDTGRIAVAEANVVSLVDRNGSLRREIRPGFSKIDTVTL